MLNLAIEPYRHLPGADLLGRLRTQYTNTEDLRAYLKNLKD
jgi:hypothetical protein